MDVGREPGSDTNAVILFSARWITVRTRYHNPQNVKQKDSGQVLITHFPQPNMGTTATAKFFKSLGVHHL